MIKTKKRPRKNRRPGSAIRKTKGKKPKDGAAFSKAFAIRDISIFNSSSAKRPKTTIYRIGRRLPNGDMHWMNPKTGEVSVEKSKDRNQEQKNLAKDRMRGNWALRLKKWASIVWYWMPRKTKATKKERGHIKFKKRK